MHLPDAEGAGQMFQVTTLDVSNPPRRQDGSVDYDADFFGRCSSLTVSGQLEGELGAMGIGEIYTFLQHLEEQVEQEQVLLMLQNICSKKPETYLERNFLERPIMCWLIL